MSGSKVENDFKNVMFSILKGDTAVFVSDADQAFVVSQMNPLPPIGNCHAHAATPKSQA
jgi:hypothetical protein